MWEILTPIIIVALVYLALKAVGKLVKLGVSIVAIVLLVNWIMNLIN